METVEPVVHFSKYNIFQSTNLNDANHREITTIWGNVPEEICFSHLFLLNILTSKIKKKKRVKSGPYVYREHIFIEEPRDMNSATI